MAGCRYSIKLLAAWMAAQHQRADARQAKTGRMPVFRVNSVPPPAAGGNGKFFAAGGGYGALLVHQ